MHSGPRNNQSMIPHGFFAPADKNALLFDILIRANKLWDRMIEIDKIIMETTIPILNIKMAAKKIKRTAQELSTLVSEFNAWNEKATNFLWDPKISLTSVRPTDSAIGFIHYSIVLTHRIIQMNEKMGAVLNNYQNKLILIRHRTSVRRGYIFFLVSILVSIAFSIYNILQRF